MNARTRYLKFLFYFCTLLLIMSCAIPSVLRKSAKGTATLQSGVSGSAGIGGQNATREPGTDASQILPDPSAGLADLDGYHASFTQDVTGTLDGKPYERHSLMELTRLIDAGQYDFINDADGSDNSGFHLRIMAQGNAFYRWMLDNPACQGSITPPADGEVVEPASLLLSIDGGVRLGSETVNQIPSVHYRFDQDSLPITKDSGPVTGDVWIAEDGGYVVKYTLSTSKPEKRPGEDLEVSQQWAYELDQVDGMDGIDLPDGCLPVPASLPAPTDAKDVQQVGGRMSYTSTSDARQVLDLYYHELPALGWIAHSELQTGEIKLPYLTFFDKEDQRLTVYINEGEKGSVDVDLLITFIEVIPVSPQEEVTATPSGEPAPAATINPGESGLPGDIPLYPGATDMLKTGEMVMFTVPDAPDVVAKYYSREMLANGWTMENETTFSDVSMQIWAKSGASITITVMVQDGSTNVVIILPE